MTRRLDPEELPPSSMPDGMWCAQVWTEPGGELVRELGDGYGSRTEACRACYDHLGETLTWTEDLPGEWWADGAAASYRVVRAP